MSTYKKSNPFGWDVAVPDTASRRPLPPPPPLPEYPDYLYYEDEEIEPVPTPAFPGRPCPPPPPRPIPPCPPPPPAPPYPVPKPEKVDECSKKLAKLSEKSKILVQMIKDFEQRNKPAILTIGPNSYQFGTESVIDFNGETGKGMYAELICGEPIETLDPLDYVVDDTKTRVALKNPVDLLQSELARVRQEITLVAAALNNEVIPNNDVNPGNIPGVNDP